MIPTQSLASLGGQLLRPKSGLRMHSSAISRTMGVKYQSERGGNKQKKCYESLKPNIHDVVLFYDSDQRKRFGVVLEVLEKNQVLIRSILAGSVIERKFHVRVLVLLYRSSEWNNDVPIE